MSVIEINHPLIEHKMTILRSVETDTKSFRQNLNEIAKLMTYIFLLFIIKKHDKNPVFYLIIFYPS